MALYGQGIQVESFEPDEDGCIRIPRCDIEETYPCGDTVFVGDDQLMGFARVVSLDGDAVTGWICVDVLAVTQAGQADELRELLDDEWRDLLDD